MKKLIILLALSACAGQTPPQQYFELKQHYSAATLVMARYRQDCDEQPKGGPCKAVVTRMQSLDNVAALAFDKADEVFIPQSNADASQDLSYREIAYLNAKVALDNLKGYLLGVK